MLIRFQFCIVLASQLLSGPLFSTEAGIFGDSATGFSITLPDSIKWKDTLLSSGHRIFKDTEKKYKAILGIRSDNYDTLVYANEHNWCTSSSIAYKFRVESQYGFIYARDSMLQDNNFAMFANADYTYTDSATQTVMFLSEHIRWTAKNKRGYEIYTLSDTADMLLHYSLYNSILNTVKIFQPAPARNRAFAERAPVAVASRDAKIQLNLSNKASGAGIFIVRSNKAYTLRGEPVRKREILQNRSDNNIVAP